MPPREREEYAGLFLRLRTPDKKRQVVISRRDQPGGVSRQLDAGRFARQWLNFFLESSFLCSGSTTVPSPGD
jgi:hypothetical protein